MIRMMRVPRYTFILALRLIEDDGIDIGSEINQVFDDLIFFFFIKIWRNFGEFGAFWFGVIGLKSPHFNVWVCGLEWYHE